MSTASKLSDQDFVYGYLGEYLDGSLSESDKQRFDALLKDPEYASLQQAFPAVRGRLQLALQSYYLRDEGMNAIRSLLQDPTVKATREQMQIQHLERDETMSNLWRRLVMIALAVGIIAYGFWLFSPEDKTFRPLEYLGYESLALEEDAAGRLDFPNSDADEVREYIMRYPGLNFSPVVLSDFGRGWELVGATVIDYEVAQVTAVQYVNKTLGEYLFHYGFAGSLNDLPKSEQGNLSNLLYQAYANDRLNFIAWQDTPEMVSILVGRRGTAELAELAVRGGAAK